MPETVLLPGTPVLTKAGRPIPGYSIGSAAIYERRRVPLGFLRRKEWDFYQIYDGKIAVQLVLGHVSYAGQAALSVLDIEGGRRLLDRGLLTPFARGMPRLPENTAASDILLTQKGVRVHFLTRADGTRLLSAEWDGAHAEFSLGAPAASVAVTTPFAGKPYAFYYNHKINGMPASGYVETAREKWEFSPERAFALLDFGRGALPFRHEWLWSSASTTLGGAPFGFNLGCFGDNSHGTENFFYIENGKEMEFIKLGAVLFERGASYTDPWRIMDAAGRLDMTLAPVFDNETATKVAFVDNRCHQVFGRFSGTVRRADGSAVAFSDVPGFAEHAANRW